MALAGRSSSSSPTPTAGRRRLAAEILARFAADPDLAALGGDIRVYPADPGRPAPAEAYEAVYAFRQQLYIERQGYSVTANIAVRRSVFDAVGGFGGIGIAEDNDWGQPRRRLGFAPSTRRRWGAASGAGDARPRSRPNGPG